MNAASGSTGGDGYGNGGGVGDRQEAIGALNECDRQGGDGNGNGNGDGQEASGGVNNL
jgi:hypothetical protein